MHSPNIASDTSRSSSIYDQWNNIPIAGSAVNAVHVFAKALFDVYHCCQWLYASVQDYSVYLNKHTYTQLFNRTFGLDASEKKGDETVVLAENQKGDETVVLAENQEEYETVASAEEQVEVVDENGEVVFVIDKILLEDRNDPPRWSVPNRVSLKSIQDAFMARSNNSNALVCRSKTPMKKKHRDVFGTEERVVPHNSAKSNRYPTNRFPTNRFPTNRSLNTILMMNNLRSTTQQNDRNIEELD